MRHLICVFGVILILCLFCPSGQCADTDGSITATARADDARMERKVSVSGERVPLGELLEELSAGTGVVVRINERDVLSGIPILVTLKEVALADAMNAIWSLLSYPKAPWRWEIEGIKGKYIYTLVPSFAAHQFSARLKAEIQRQFEEHAAVMLQIAQLSPEERKTRIKDMTHSVLLAGDGYAKAWIADELPWAGLRTFAQSVSPDEMAQVLRSEKQVTLPISKMSEEGRAFVKSAMARAHSSVTGQDGVVTIPPEPENITIVTGAFLGEVTIAPGLYIYLNGAGLSYMGGPALDLGVQNSLGKQWQLPGDAEDDALETRSLTKPVNEPRQPVADPTQGGLNETYAISLGLQQLAAATPLSVLALLPDGQGQAPGAPYGMTAKAYLDSMKVQSKVNRKWRAHVLLLCNPLRLLSEDVNVPYRCLKHLTHSGVRRTNFLSLADLAEIQATLTNRQLAIASKHYSVLRYVKQFAPLLALYAANRDLGRTGGLSLTPELLAALGQVVSLPPQHDIMTGQALGLRLVTQDDAMANVPIRRVRLEYLRSDRKWAFVTGFMQVGTADAKAGN
jgi:hypothetical protein